MAVFDNREKEFEDKFFHDAEVAFRVKSISIKLLASWAAEQIGVDVEEYSNEVITNSIGLGETEIDKKIFNDLKKKHIEISEDDFAQKVKEFKNQARDKVKSKS